MLDYCCLFHPGLHDRDLYLVLDYVDGAALDRLIKRKLGGGPLSPAAVAYVVGQVGREVGEAAIMASTTPASA